MASPHGSLDAMVNVKVVFQGKTIRAKMPLRDTAPLVLEKRMRMFLHVPEDSDIVLERYSDSAASYIMLDTTKPAVYKQLHRAAKAKSKLKLRATLKRRGDMAPLIGDSAFHYPVTSNDSAPSNLLAPDTTEPQATETERVAVANNEAEPAVPHLLDDLCVPPSGLSSMSKTYDLSTLKEAARLAESANLDARLNRARGLASLLGQQCQNFGAQLAQQTAPICGEPEQAQPTEATKAVESLPKSGAHPTVSTPGRVRFAICCNSCEQTTPDIHYHCSTCEDGDFDLCQSCVDQGITCHGGDHWLIKRATVDGHVVTSTTETIAPKPKAKKQEPLSLPEPHSFAAPSFCSTEARAALARLEKTMSGLRLSNNLRTCNCCVEERSEQDFLHCQVCDDFDLCQPCFSKDSHGHHPKHAFAPAVAGTVMPDHINAKLAPGRNQAHNAICDGCDKYITGIRNKCLDCPDWDFCADCIPSASVTHPKHRFVPVYEPLNMTFNTVCPASRLVHAGICCDGPLCDTVKGYPVYIRGIRYKCAVCHDVDFCAGCEASPSNKHNKTHPLIKFKTPIRHVSVTTTGEHSDGQRMPTMGDRRNDGKATCPYKSSPTPLMNTVQTVFAMEPEAPTAAVTPVEPQPLVEIHPEEAENEVKVTEIGDLRAVFLRDAVADGTIFPPNHVFEQTWVLRNDGTTSWPAGCSVKFVGGDYMGHVDSNHPAGVSELVSASESTVCHEALAPGQSFPFSVKLRTPPRAGKTVSFWRLTTQDGNKFGHRLWCEVAVRFVQVETPPESTTPIVEMAKEEEVLTVNTSQMIFPKLENESPIASIHEETSKGASARDEDKLSVDDDFEECGDDEWDVSEDGFMTDEEYDILDASDEEFLEEQQKKLLTK